MATTGPKFPTSGTTTSESPWSDNTWTTPENITADDTAEASVTAGTFDATDQTEVLKGFGFDFSAIPDGSTILGVEAKILARADSTSVLIDLAQLLDVSRAKVGTNLALAPSNDIPLTTSDAVYTIGGASNLWGNALTAAWVKDPDFGIALGVRADVANSQVFIEYVTLEITYTAPPAAVDVDGDLAATATVAGTAAADHTVTGNLAAAATLTATAAAEVTVAGNLAATATLAGSIDVVPPGGTIVDVDGDLAATATVTGAATADHTVAGDLAVTATTIGAAVPDHTVGGDRPATATITGDIDVIQPGLVNVDGNLAVTAIHTATAAVAIALAGNRPTTATLTGTIDVIGQPQVDVDGNRPTVAGLIGAATVARATDGGLAVTASRTGTINLVADMAGTLTAQAVITGSIDVAAAYIPQHSHFGARGATSGRHGRHTSTSVSSGAVS